MGILLILVVDFSKFGKVEDVEMFWIKKIFGFVLYCFWLNILYVIYNDEVDIMDLDKYCKEMDMMVKENGYCVILLSFVIKVLVFVLKEYWEVNSLIYLDGDKLIKKDFYNIGFVVDMLNGLMVLVIKDVDCKGIVEIFKDFMDFFGKVCEGKLKGDDMLGVIFMILFLGGIGGMFFIFIVNVFEVVIFGLIWFKMVLVWNGEEFVLCLM